MKGSKQRRGKRWRLVADVGPDPITGKRRQATRMVDGTSRQADAALTRFLAELGAGQLHGHDAPLAATVDAWIDHVAAELSPTTVRDYRYAVAKHLHDSAIGRTPTWKLSANDLDRWYRALSASGLGAARVQRLHAIVRRSLAQAVRWGWLARNVAADATPPTVTAAKIRPPTPADVRRLIAAAPPELAAWLIVAATLGARRGEIVGLRWSDVDLDAGSVVIQRGLVDAGGGTILAKSTKTDRVRVVALDPVTVDVLRRHRRVAIEVALALGVAYTGDAWVFHHDPEGLVPWRPDYVTLSFRRLRARLGLEHVRLHDLRHFVATELLAAGVDVRTVAGRLGHARTSITLDVYAAFVQARDQDAAAAMGRIVGYSSNVSGS